MPRFNRGLESEGSPFLARKKVKGKVERLFSTLLGANRRAGHHIESEHEMEGTRRYASTFDGLLELVAHLRGSEGCPWDREQTRGSMKRFLLEECYELLEAIDGGEAGRLAEELGDVLFNLAFQVHLGKEEGTLSQEKVFAAVIEKLVRRHPHVFGDVRADSAREVEERWDELKRAERGHIEASILDGVPKELPALAHAQSLQERAARAGFDWEDAQGVVDKVGEEVLELQRAESAEERESELGDILFSMVNLGRWLAIDTEGALRKADARFRKRYALMEKLSKERGTSFEAMDMDEKEALWQEAKRLTG